VVVDTGLVRQTKEGRINEYRHEMTGGELPTAMSCMTSIAVLRSATSAAEPSPTLMLGINDKDDGFERDA